METFLFSPLTIRGITLKNRIVLSPMLTYSATNGHVGDWHAMHLGKFAVSGAGLVFMEATKVDPRGCSTARDVGLWKDEFIAPLQKITSFIKRYGAASGIQLAHSGRKARQSLPWEGRAPVAGVPGVDHGEEWEVIGPSAVPHSDNFPTPRAMTHQDVLGMIELWGKAAERALRAGFDVLELHAAHGYLIHQFLSERANRRTDEYGGSFNNRLRFAVEIAERVRRSWPTDKPLFVRMSAVDGHGWEIEHSIALARALKQAGVDVIDCSAGGMDVGLPSAQPTAMRYGYQVDYAEKIRAGVGIKTMAVGLIIHADQAEAILKDGRADLVALGREFFHNPNWPIDAAQKLGMDPSVAGIPDAYGYWLDKRARSNFAGKPSTWQPGIGTD